MKKKITVFAALLLFYYPLLQAKDSKEQFATYGLGGESCAAYMQARNAGGDAEDAYRQWLAGYVSAFNLIIGSTYDLFGSTDFEGMMTWLDKRCEKYPRANLTNTIARFSEIVFPYRKQEKPAVSK